MFLFGKENDEDDKKRVNEAKDDIITLVKLRHLLIKSPLNITTTVRNERKDEWLFGDC